ncbi:hypothetical protein L228DRAFT_279232 [Xylona heveae TC161]|uniref:Cystathionine beta-synthase n=1 Tax=Xylona heveae (strain CBS 132557 / TC161) TaxID=1328760 RepID=A0A165JAH1_XYLHT|nr:hypothetical protein L228DRAFT_279232 [Xylona heveae TC161]KZF25971.1 hypothetical protein L228DRAFT_279232 [Xylona heveae TC161]
MAAAGTATATAPPDIASQNQVKSPWANRYRGATVEDLDPPTALSCKPTDSISHALMSAYERDYTHLTVVSKDTRALLGYLSIPRLRELLQAGSVHEDDPVEKAMMRFRRKGKTYHVITMDTPLEELEDFFNGGGVHESGPQDFAVVTDESRKFVLGVATRSDLEEFVKRRPA